MSASKPPLKPLRPVAAVLFVLVAAVCFNIAYSTSWAFLIFGYIFSLIQLARLEKMKWAFCAGFAAGFLAFAPQLGFFARIFGPFSVILWGILAFWIALVVALAQTALFRVGAGKAVWLVPLLWMGLEYFRSELYFLRFTWLNIGFAFSDVCESIPFSLVGVYGVGFIAAFVVVCVVVRRYKTLLFTIIGGAILAGLALPATNVLSKPKTFSIAGIQMEFPTPDEAIAGLDKLIAECPAAKVVVLSEYSFHGPVPERVREWCRVNQRYLIAGGTDPAPDGDYYNTVFVIDPAGEVVFKQAKSVPIQFFSDGLPAPGQQVWESPWGRIGICICYDLSYARVTDRLVGLGAQALIVPTMDVQGWGRHEHELHTRVARVRAAEYGIPIFRIASSGISQFVSPSGKELSSAPYRGNRAIISGNMVIRDARKWIPLDRILAPVSCVVTVGFLLWLAVTSLPRRFRKSEKSSGAAPAP